jgi:acyl-CoA reductase-like NAD-dependent aldehyde dehydrogenase
MKYIDDLSYSNLVNLIQGEESKAADILNTIALEMEEHNSYLAELESKLNCAKSRKESLIAGAKRVMHHIKRDYPLSVKRQDYIVVVTEENISIERNVI